ncbi:toast rack family protein [Alkalihalobacillus sp. AL-G]|uniref:toast rack family protein n=1 Tax=Alkalihalobacillus sp. AL-G TaxID=2926399 RepID=UPI00272A8029|nr:toast rack family protein [Alkalihalobacillus sp. AL-G]WLD92760.1 toast rack family protein [Alkalihalobacillus sp. AL-G]
MNLEHTKLGKIALAAFAIFLIGVGGIVVTGFQPSNDKNNGEYIEVVELNEASSVEAEIEMGIADLTVNGGAEDLMRGKFHYNENAGKPDIAYEVNGGKGELDVSNEDKDSWLDFDWIRFGEQTDEWEIALNDKVPLDLEVSTGVGDSKLDLSGLNLTRLDIDSGVGETVLDLSGDWERSFNVSIDGGVGDTTIFIPEDVGVRITADLGVGGLNIQGLTIQGNSYLNNAYNESDVKLEIDLDMGVGSVNIIREDLR